MPLCLLPFLLFLTISPSQDFEDLLNVLKNRGTEEASAQLDKRYPDLYAYGISLESENMARWFEVLHAKTNSPRDLVGLAWANFSLKKSDVAYEQASKALMETEDSSVKAKASYILLVVDGFRGNVKKAIEHGQKAVTWYGGDGKAKLTCYLTMAQILLVVDDLDGANEAIFQGEGYLNHATVALLAKYDEIKSELLWKQGSNHAAIQKAEKARREYISLGKNNWELDIRVALLMAVQGREPEALLLAKDAEAYGMGQSNLFALANAHAILYFLSKCDGSESAHYLTTVKAYKGEGKEKVEALLTFLNKQDCQ